MGKKQTTVGGKRRNRKTYRNRTEVAAVMSSVFLPRAESPSAGAFSELEEKWFAEGEMLGEIEPDRFD